MKRIPEERLETLTEREYLLNFGVSKEEFDRMLATLETAYRTEHKREPRFRKITIKDRLIFTLRYRQEYRSMESIAKEYEVCVDTIENNIHWVEQILLNEDLIQASVTCVYRLN